MANIPIRDITTTGVPSGTSLVAFDDGSMKKATIASMADAVRPVASESEATAGTDNTKISTPLRVKQYIDAQVGVTLASKAQGDLANSAVQPGSLGALATKNKIGIADINYTGTPSTTTWLRGDGAFATPAGGGDMVAANNLSDLSNIDGAKTNLGLFESKVAAVASVLDQVPEWVQTAVYNNAEDGGALYKNNGTTSGDLVLTQTGGVLKGFNIIQPELRPSMFGAIGDGDGSGGGTDDAAALQIALNTAAARKRPLLFKNAIYRANSGLIVPAGVEIDLGQGSIDLKAIAATAKGLQFTNGGALYGRGGALLGPGSSVVSSGAAISCFGTFNSGTAPTFVNAPIIEGIEIANFAGYGVNVGYAQDGRIRNCKIHDIGYAGVGGVSCNRFHVRESRIKDIASTGGSGDHYGVFIDRQDGVSETSDPRSYDCDISGNIVENIDWEGLDTHGGVGFKFTRNTVRNCGRGISLTRSVISGVAALAPKNCVVEGNLIENSSSTAKEGIGVIGAYNGSSVVDTADNNVISGNIIIGHGTDGDTVGALYAYGTKNLTATGNSFITSWQNSISLNFSNLGFNLSGNTYRDPRSTTGAASCIRSYGADNRGYIGGETFRYSGSISTFTADRSLVVDSASGTDIVMGRCAYVGLDSTHLQITGTGVSACDLSQAWSQSGTATVSCVSGQASNSATVSFAKASPLGTIKIEMSLASVYIGTKLPQFRSASKAATGFTLVVYPAAGGNWDASGDLFVDWRATL